MPKFKLFLILLGIFVSKTSCQDFTVTPITTSSGLYYEKIGEVLLSNSNWEFVTSLDYKAYLLFYEYLLQQATQLENFCEATDSAACKQRYSTIKIQLERIEKTHESLANLLGVSIQHRRVKRFWTAIGTFLSRLGPVVRAIFGAGSGQTDLTGIENSINNLQNGQRDLQNQINLQRTVFLIDSERKTFEINMLKKSQNDIQKSVSSLEKTVQLNNEKQMKELKALKETLSGIENKIKEQEKLQKKLTGRVNDIEKTLLAVDKDIKEVNEKIEKNKKDIELVNKLIIIFNHFDFLREEFEKEQEHLLSVVNKVNIGQMDSYIVTPSSLIEMLQDIQPQLPEGTTFPYYPNIENSKKLYKIIKPSVYLFNYKIIFVLRIPLVYSKKFHLHKITSLPLHVGDKKFIFILPQEPYIIIDSKYQEYVPMSRNDFLTYCIKLETSKYKCKQIQEILNSQTSEDCEVNLYKSTTEIPMSCNKRIMALNKSMFLQLQRDNSWIYAVPETENIIITCGENRVTRVLTGTGFIHGDKDCLLRTNDFELSYLYIFTKPVGSNFTPPNNLLNYIDVSQYADIKVKGKKSVQQVFPFEFEKLEEVSYSIMNARANLVPLYCTLFPILIIIATVFTYLAYKKKNDVRKLYNFRYLISLCRKDLQHDTNVDNTKTEIKNDLKIEPDADTRKIKIKVKNQDDIQDVSIYGRTSEIDPDSEYLTVRFKVRKDKIEPSAPKEVSNLNIQENSPLTSKGKLLNNETHNSRPKVLKEERYLEELRKLKPKMEH